IICYFVSFCVLLKCHLCLCFSWKAFGFSRKALNFFRYAASSFKSSLSRSNSSSRVNFFSSFFFCLFGFLDIEGLPFDLGFRPSIPCSRNTFNQRTIKEGLFK